jgi:hypothetical protein
MELDDKLMILDEPPLIQLKKNCQSKPSALHRSIEHSLDKSNRRTGQIRILIVSYSINSPASSPTPNLYAQRP